MAKDRSPTSSDPFGDVDAKSVTEVEMDERVSLQREPLPAAAKLTDLPMHWVLITLLVCIGISELGQRVERKHLFQTARESGLFTDDEIANAEKTGELVDNREEIQKRIDELKDRRETLKQRRSELEKRREEFDKLKTGLDASDPGPEAEPEAEIPLTLESLRAELRRIAGDQYDTYRKFATLVALLIGALGLILLAVFVRVLAAAILGGITGGVLFFVQVDPWIMWTGAAAAAGIGAWLAPKLLLANMLFNVALAGLILGGTAGGGAVYLVTGNELYSIFGLGVGLVVGALIGFKYLRQLFLSAVLANAAGFGTLVLWLAWGELFAHFWPITFGGLMITDAVATRIYHKVRWA